MKILAIESSCDETAVAVIDGRGDKVTVLSNVVASQIEIHQKYGGVVPEVAAREHVLNIIPVVNEALFKAGIKPNQANKKLSALAVTAGPGLITSLTVGVETAKCLAYGWGLPLIAVNHIAGHIYSNWLESETKQTIKFPALIMTVSGGHNLLVLMKDHLAFEIIGDTLDDAAGEAFDKGAKMLGLGYPGGPAIAQISINGQSQADIRLPRPMINSDNFNFSFSGLKTALLYALKKDHDWQSKIPDYAHEYQQAIIDTLINKTIRAVKKYQAKTVMLSGGVSANAELRRQFSETFHRLYPTTAIRYPARIYTTDNAAMIAAAGYFMARAKKFITWPDIVADSNLNLK